MKKERLVNRKHTEVISATLYSESSSSCSASKRAISASCWMRLAFQYSSLRWGTSRKNCGTSGEERGVVSSFFPLSPRERRLRQHHTCPSTGGGAGEWDGCEASLPLHWIFLWFDRLIWGSSASGDSPKRARGHGSCSEGS